MPDTATRRVALKKRDFSRGLKEPPKSGLARFRSPIVPEDSVRLRIVVLASVLLAIAATVAQRVISIETAIGAFILVPAGFWFSYRRRAHRNIPVKILLAVGMLVALGIFLQRVRQASSVDEARAMLAELFIWTQVLHSFDLPRRKDLAYSMGSSLVLMAAAGSLTLDGWFALFLLPYLGLAGAWLALSYRANVRDRTTRANVRRIPTTHDRRAPVTRYVFISVAIVLGLAMGVFAVMPRLEGIQVVAPPFQMQQTTGIPGFSGDVVNPGLPSSSGDPSAVPGFSPGAYPGFGESIDLRVRGILSDEVVMKVRASQPALWRAQVYDTWDGNRWTASQTDTTTLGQGEVPTNVPPPEESPLLGPTRRLVQTFYLEEQQPNIVFAATQPRYIYFPAAGLQMDAYGSIRAPILMDPGVVYSVISDIPTATSQELRAVPMDWKASDFFDRYTQLPASTPQRVIDLAQTITDPEPTIYGKTKAIEDWLKANTEYKLDIPPDPPNVDAVDHFLFETRRGYCEHLSAAMIVMLRAVGIPSRFAVGFDPGDRNLLTGYFEVRESDAHSWVEVNYPGVGWIQYDPTRAVPLAEPGAENTFTGAKVFGALGKLLGAIIPEPVRDLAGKAAGAVGDLAKSAAQHWPITLLVTALMIGAVLLISRLRPRGGRALPSTHGAAAAFDRTQAVFAGRGYDRRPERTPSEYLRELVRHDELAKREADDLRLVVRTFEWDRFGPEPPGEDVVERALQAADRLDRRAKIAASGSGSGRREG